MLARLFFNVSILSSLLLGQLRAEDLESSVARMARIGYASSPSFSPDGKRIALLSNLSGSPQIWVIPSTGGWPELVSSFDDPVNEFAWSPTGDWIAAQVAPGGGLNEQIYLLRPDGTGVRRLTDGGSETNWLNGWGRDGRFLTIASNRRSRDAMDNYVVDLPSGTMRLVTKNSGIGSYSDVSRDGRYALLDRLVSRGNNDLFRVDLATGEELLVTRHTPPGTFSGRFGADSNTVWMSGDDGRDLAALQRVRIIDGKAGPIESVIERNDAELEAIEVNDDGTRAILLWNVAGRSEISVVDLTTAKTLATPPLPQEMAGGLTFSHDGRHLAASLSGATASSDVWMADSERWQFTRLTASPHAGVDLSTLVRPQLLEYSAPDGVRLSGWLYLPVSGKPPYPTVFNYHGGPEGQSRPSFNSTNQALLSQGIAVFLPNVRGSSGFGKKFVNLDNGALRVNGVKDIKTTADALISRGIADRDRLGIMGGSYGGYMVMAGVTEYPDLFRAGADLFGVVNFETFFAQSQPWMAAISTIEYGDPKTQKQMLYDLSPIHKLDRVKARMLVLHGANDTNVPVVEAEQVVNGLKARGVPVSYILFPGEGHGWRQTANRIRSAVEVTRFFVDALKGQATK